MAGHSKKLARQGLGPCLNSNPSNLRSCTSVVVSYSV
uniref:Uncharacterized protein n=1 Tax=Arundo donax TaxID=35708 RepID=A0A0A9G9F5_ARUDO